MEWKDFAVTAPDKWAEFAPSNSAQLIDNCCNSVIEGLTRLNDKQTDFKSCIDYLKRQDVRAQAVKIIEDLAERHSGQWMAAAVMKGMLGLHYLEVGVLCVDKALYVLNFWPCSACACVACNEQPGYPPQK